MKINNKEIQQIVIKNMMNEFKHIYVKTENELKEILKSLNHNIIKYEQNRLREFLNIQANMIVLQFLSSR